MKYEDLTPLHLEQLPVGDSITALAINFKNRPISCYIFKDSEDSICCLLETNDLSYKLPKLSSLNMRYQHFAVKGGAMQSFILLENKISTYVKQFTEIIKEICFVIDSSSDPVALIVNKTIEKWRRFLAMPLSPILEEKEILGLFGELYFLDRLIEEFKEKGIEMWCANTANIDFASEKSIVEVKTSKGTKLHHQINGIDQLALVPGKSKYLFSLLVQESASAESFNLPTLIESITNKLLIFPGYGDFFEIKLLERGYSFTHSNDYSAFKYSVSHAALFLVDNNFPKLSSDELKHPLHKSVTQVSYIVNLENLPCHKLSEVSLWNILT